MLSPWWEGFVLGAAAVLILELVILLAWVLATEGEIR